MRGFLTPARRLTAVLCFVAGSSLFGAAVDPTADSNVGLRGGMVLMAAGLWWAALAFARLARAGAPAPAAGAHTHVCAQCGHSWTHGVECFGDAEAHTCECGVSVWETAEVPALGTPLTAALRKQ